MLGVGALVLIEVLVLGRRQGAISKAWKCLFVALGNSALVSGLLLSMNVPKYWSLRRDGVRVDAVVTGKDASRHEFVDYSFVVDGRRFSASGWPGYGNDEFGSLRIGDRLIAFYSPADPSVACLGSPGAWLENELTAGVGGFLLLSAGLFFALWKWRARIAARAATSG